jgi:PAS domain S-box-containing protein
MSPPTSEFEFLWEQAAFPIALVDVEGLYRKVNPAFLQLFGYSRDHEVIGRAVLDLTHPEDVEKTTSHREGLISGDTDRVKVEKRYVAKDGRIIWAHTLVTPVRDESRGVKYFMVQIQDVSEIHSAHTSMVQAARMVALGEMAAGLAHEINNPLTIIKGYADLIAHQIKKGSSDFSEIERHSAQIRATTDRVTRIIQALRRFSRDHVDFPLEPLLIRDVVDDALSICGERFKNNGVRVEISGDLPDPVFCNGVALSQVLLNLFNNSLHAVKELPDRWVRVILEGGPGSIRLSVIDSGSGIQEPVRSKIFVPFFTTKPPGEGTGLGLSVSKGIVESFGGTIRLADGPHTRFDLDLPLQAAGI